MEIISQRKETTRIKEKIFSLSSEVKNFTEKGIFSEICLEEKISHSERSEES